MSHNQPYVISVERSPEKPTPYFTFNVDGLLGEGEIQLFTEGSPTLEATCVLYRRVNDVLIRAAEFVTFMPDSYQNYTVTSLRNVEVGPGDRLEFTTNENSCIYNYVFTCWAEETPCCVPDLDPNAEPSLCSTLIEKSYSQSILVIGTLSL